MFLFGILVNIQLLTNTDAKTPMGIPSDKTRLLKDQYKQQLVSAAVPEKQVSIAAFYEKHPGVHWNYFSFCVCPEFVQGPLTEIQCL